LDDLLIVLFDHLSFSFGIFISGGFCHTGRQVLISTVVSSNLVGKLDDFQNRPFPKFAANCTKDSAHPMAVRPCLPITFPMSCLATRKLKNSRMPAFDGGDFYILGPVNQLLGNGLTTLSCGFLLSVYYAKDIACSGRVAIIKSNTSARGLMSFSPKTDM